ncbi:unnamed protein product, partial [Iphiclides podalirius]
MTDTLPIRSNSSDQFTMLSVYKRAPYRSFNSLCVQVVSPLSDGASAGSSDSKPHPSPGLYNGLTLRGKEEKPT